MKIEFNSVGINSNSNSPLDDLGGFNFALSSKILRENGSLILAIISALLAFLNLPFGLFMNLSTEILNRLTEHGSHHWLVVLFVVSFVIALLSVLLGIFSIVMFVRSEKNTVQYIALSLSISAFVISSVCIALDIYSLLSW